MEGWAPYCIDWSTRATPRACRRALMLRDRYAFDERGIIDIKGKGPMRTYFLRDLR